MFRIYKLLKGTIAFNIFIGVLLLYVLWWVVGILDMNLLSLVLGKFVGFGVLILIVIFQPEVRRFLLMLGNSTLKGRLNFLHRFFGNQEMEITKDQYLQADEICAAVKVLSERKIGALIVLSNSINLEDLSATGTKLDARISSELIQNIFFTNSPLHDGAMIIANRRIHSASSVLPVSHSAGLPNNFGLRHRAAIGVTENMSVAAIVVSEETGAVSFSTKGKLKSNLSISELKGLITSYI